MRLCCHTLVTSDDIVTVMVTSHRTQKSVKGSRKIMSYNMYYIC